MKRMRNSGFTLVEIMIVVAIIALLAAIAIPNVLRGRTSANEAAAIGNQRALISSLEMYRSVNNVYPDAAGNWGTLMYPGGGVPAFGPPSFNTANLAGFVVQGYTYTYVPGSAAPVNTYTITVTPQVVNQTGTRSFRASSAGTITHVTGGTAPAVGCTVTIDAPPGTSGSGGC